MGVFVSYSSRDGAALAQVTAALRRAHIEAWLDEELTGGEAWWNAILEQIRGCEVFIAALSKNYLESKPCQAELRYAQDLHRPILPVQIGPLDSMRVNPLAAVQAIDYQNPSIESGIELIAAVHARNANARPAAVTAARTPASAVCLSDAVEHCASGCGTHRRRTSATVLRSQLRARHRWP